jgi:two-component system sensor histidine kinase RstB
MTRLFIRVYLGAIGILLVGALMVAFASQRRFDTDFAYAKERALGASIELTKESLDAAGDSVATVVEQLQANAKYPIRVTSNEEAPAAVRHMLSAGQDVMAQVGNELSIVVPLQNGADAVWFGPIELTDGVIETDMKVGLVAAPVFAALAIALLLRPLARQLGVLEQAAVSIASGNLSARVDLQQAGSAAALARAFNNMAARTEALVRTQRELLQAVSHELRTPLARISFASALIRSARDGNEREARLKTLEKSAEELDELVGELLQYAREEAGGLPAAREYVELLPLVQQLIEKHSLGRAAIHFEIGSGLASGEVQVLADPSGLARALSNLIGNAGRFARHEVVVDAIVRPEGVTIEVDDDGPGIPPDDRERVFEPFVRLDEETSGAGLGLSLVKRIVTNHGGSVIASTTPYHGCRIRTFWPTDAL